LAGWLAIVATPIGNLEDVSPRAVRTLAEADAILAEDTRRTRALLTHLGIAGKELARVDANTERGAAGRWLVRVAAGGKIALCTDAGTPAVSDPGAALVREAGERGLTVVPIPGPSAVVAALAASGMPADRFRFFGFLPRKGMAREEAIAAVAGTEETVVLFESPERAEHTLADLAARMPERAAVVARELTKMHEELARGTLAALAERREWRGELTVVLGPWHAAPQAVDIEARIAELRARGMRPKEIAKALAAETGLPASELYAKVIASARG
jgi:16S rRNA (cytidine1402-2'-O)-methyltransferase